MASKILTRVPKKTGGIAAKTGINSPTKTPMTIDPGDTRKPSITVFNVGANACAAAFPPGIPKITPGTTPITPYAKAIPE